MIHCKRIRRRVGTALLGLSAGLLLATHQHAAADSWYYEPILSKEVTVFGDTRIVRSTDARRNQGYPDYSIAIYKKKRKIAQYRGVSFERIFASPDNKLFVGLSNQGLPGTAVIVFDDQGRLRIEAKHGTARFNYCDESVTLIRTWFDQENPGVRFVTDKKHDGLKEIRLRDCHGREVELIRTVMEAYERSLQRQRLNEKE